MHPKFLVPLLLLLWSLPQQTHAEINIGIEAGSVGGADNYLTIFYTATTDYSAPPFNFWNSQLFTLRWSTSLGGDVIQSLTNTAAYSFALDGTAADGGDGFYYQKITSSATAVVQSIALGARLDVLSIRVAHPTIELGDFELVTSPNPWVEANFGVASVNAGVGGEQFNIFSPAIATNVILPLELLAFSATTAEDHIDLEWSTANEFNVAFFSLERSTDAARFREVAQSAATNLPAASYAWGDHDVQGGLWYYYRLRMVDVDGSFSYSPVRSARLPQAGPGPGDVALYPNPVIGPATLQLSLSNGDNFQIQVISADGRTVQMVQRWLDPGYHQIPLQLDALAAGNYVLQLTEGTNAPKALRFTKVSRSQ